MGSAASSPLLLQLSWQEGRIPRTLSKNSTWKTNKHGEPRGRTPGPRRAVNGPSVATPAGARAACGGPPGLAQGGGGDVGPSAPFHRRPERQGRSELCERFPKWSVWARRDFLAHVGGP